MHRLEVTVDVAEILVPLGGALLIPLILWYFFWSEREATRVRSSGGGVQEIEVQVKGGYDPDVLVVEAGRPVRIDFRRQETAWRKTSSCAPWEHPR